MRMNHRSDAPIIPQGNVVEEVNWLTFLGSKVTTDGESELEIKARLSKAGQAFASSKNIWKSKRTILKTRRHRFKSNVLATLLYGCELWKFTKPSAANSTHSRTAAFPESGTSSGLTPSRMPSYTGQPRQTSSLLR